MGNHWSGPVTSLILWFHWSAPLVSHSTWSDCRSESQSESGPLSGSVVRQTLSDVTIVRCLVSYRNPAYPLLIRHKILSDGSPRARLRVVGMLRLMSKTQTNRACPLLFSLFLCLFLSLWRFQLYLIPWILPTTLRFLTLFFRSYLCLIGLFNFISLYESLLQPWYNP